MAIEYVQIGYTQKAHGIVGEIKVSIEARYLEDFLKNERVFLNIKGAKVPYFIENMRGENVLIVHFEDVDNRDTAIALQSREIYLRQQDLIPDDERELEPEDDNLSYQHLTGYTILDATLGHVGVIEEMYEMPQQEMAMIRRDNREILIPVNQYLIRNIDDNTKQVLMDLPEGLLDM